MQIKSVGNHFWRLLLMPATINSDETPSGKKNLETAPSPSPLVVFHLPFLAFPVSPLSVFSSFQKHCAKHLRETETGGIYCSALVEGSCIFPRLFIPRALRKALSEIDGELKRQPRLTALRPYFVEKR